MNAIALRAETVDATVCGPGFFLEANPFRVGSMRYVEVDQPGATLDDYAHAAVRYLPPGYERFLQIYVGENRVPPDKWALVRPKPTANVYIRVRPQGSGAKNILRAVLMIAIVAIAVYFLGPASGFVTTTLGLTGTAAAAASAALVGTAVMIGSLALNALIPPPGLTNSSGNKDPRYQLTGSNNRYAPYAPIPRLFGKMRIYPLLAALPFTENVGKEQYLRMLLLVGWGPIKVSDIRIGNTPIEAFRNVEYQVNEGGPSGWPGNAATSLYNREVTETQLSIELAYLVPAPLQVTELNTVEISVDIAFPYGLIEFESDGDQDTATSRHKIEYRAVGSGTWLAAPLVDVGEGEIESGGVLKTTNKTPDALRYTARWTVPEGQYEVRVTRQDFVKQGSNVDDDTWLDKSYWVTLRSFTTNEPVLQDGLCLIAIRMQASDQLNGVPDTISCTAEAYLPVLTSSNLNLAANYSLTQSPARAFADILRRRFGERYLDDSRIDLTTLQAWDAECNATAPNASEPRWTYNGVIEGGSIYEALRQVAAIGRAVYTLKDGKHSVARDKEQSTQVQHITPANSWGFSSTRNFIDTPHALKIEFQDKDREYQVNERIVYMDGYSAANAERYEVLQLFGCTSSTLAYREGRYYLAVGILRPEEHRVTMDIENLRCTLGDRVELSHDVIAVGKAWGRIVSLVTSGSDTIGFVLDGPIEFEAATSYKLRVRHSDNTTSIRTVTAAGVGFYDTISCTAEPTASGPQPGDLFMFGVSGVETFPCIVKRIEPAEDLSATLVLAPYNAAIYTADTGTIPPFDGGIGTGPPPGGGGVIRVPPDPPTIALRSDVSATKRGTYEIRLAVDITAPPSSVGPVTGYTIQYRLEGATDWITRGTTFTRRSTTVYIPGVEVGESYEVRVRSEGVVGLFSDWVEAGPHTITGNVQAPAAPTGGTIRMMAGGNIIEWVKPRNLDLRGVQLWVNGLNSFDGALMIDETSSPRTTRLMHEPVYPGDIYHYWLVSVNLSGMSSSPAYVGEAARPQGADTTSGDSYVESPNSFGGTGYGGGGGWRLRGWDTVTY